MLNVFLNNFYMVYQLISFTRLCLPWFENEIQSIYKVMNRLLLWTLHTQVILLIFLMWLKVSHCSSAFLLSCDSSLQQTTIMSNHLPRLSVARFSRYRIRGPMVACRSFHKEVIYEAEFLDLSDKFSVIRIEKVTTSLTNHYWSWLRSARFLIEEKWWIFMVNFKMIHCGSSWNNKYFMLMIFFFFFNHHLDRLQFLSYFVYRCLP